MITFDCRLQLCVPKGLLLAPGKENRIGIELAEISGMRLDVIDDSLKSDEWRSPICSNANTVTRLESSHF